jgi:ABC-type phosphate/phosphonate transport system substrate-binding protein
VAARTRVNPEAPVRTILGILTVALTCGLAAAGDPPIRVGIPRTFFHDLNDKQIAPITEPFADVMKETTGLTGEPIVGGDALAVARKVNDKQLQLGVFHGHEYAWARQKYPDFKALMVAVDGKAEMRAHVLVPKDSPVKTFADLKGKGVALPSRTKDPVRVFVEQLARKAGAGDLKAFAGSVPKPGNVETTLNQLAIKKLPAVAVDTTGLDFYKDLQPALFGRLREVAKSDPFPQAVVAYRPGVLSDDTINRIRDGLRRADKTESGQEMMKLWRITGFAAVPPDYDQQLAAVLKAYPAPAEKK